MKSEAPLVEFKDGFAAGYVFAVPECFRDALEKEKFNAGDVFYDHQAAYKKKWGEALSEISVALQIKDNLGGMIRVAILRPDGAKSQMVSMDEKTVTVEEFGTILKNGLK